VSTPVIELHPRVPERLRNAVQVKEQYDITAWPDLDWFNSAPCPRHSPDLVPSCNYCGIRLRRHQRIGAAWLYMAGSGLLSDPVGSGKTAQVLAMLAMCKAQGELGLNDRCVIVCKPAAVGQWAEQVRRLLPGIQVLEANGTPQQRRRGYLSSWEVCVISDRTFAPARAQRNTGKSRPGDVATLRDYPVRILAYDDVDGMRNRTTRIFYAITKLAETCHRVIGVHGTPLQKRLMELWSFLAPVGGASDWALGTSSRCKQRYVRQSARYITTPAMVCPEGHLSPQGFRSCTHDQTGDGNRCGLPTMLDPTGQKVVRELLQDTGINEQNAPEFRSRIHPLVLRRTTEDLDDVEMPDIQPNPVSIELTPAQKKAYTELRKSAQGRLRKLVTVRDGLEEVTQIEAQQAFMKGWQICSGMAALGGDDISAKFDWVVEKLTGDLDGEKAVIFSYFTDNVEALGHRLDKAGIGHVKFWSRETDPGLRDMRRRQFMEDPRCRVLLGTTTIEQSLNLQAARHLIACDTILNPARMTQLVGRVRRQGSAFKTVYFHHLLAQDTQEDGYLKLLGEEQLLADVVWNESSDIFATMTPAQLLSLVAYGDAGQADRLAA
jgi:SNF2 family DNA or RNA helicase